MSELHKIEQQLADGVADGRLTPDDADTVREFASFLRDAGAPGEPLPMPILERYQDLLGLTDDDLAIARANRRDVPSAEVESEQ
jgi:hypothetical protein